MLHLRQVQVARECALTLPSSGPAYGGPLKSNVRPHYMPQHFPITATSFTREEWGWLVLLGSIEAMDEQPYLMMQLAHEFSEDDVRLGQDRPYIEINNQGWSWYGHVVKLELQRDCVSVQMDQEAQQRMGNDGKFTFSFSLTHEAFEELKTVLARIFEGCTYYAPRAA